MNPQPESAIWSHDVGQQIACGSPGKINHNMDAKNHRCSYGNGAAFLFSRYWRTDRRTDCHVSTQIFQIDGLLNFLKYGAPLARLRVQENI